MAPTSHLPRRTQAACCYTAAMDTGATWCGTCGHALIRCMAFEECGGLLDDAGLCTVCVAPQAQIDAGALTHAKVGGAVAIPLSVANLSLVGRPLFVTAVWSREGDGDWRVQDFGWERLNTGERRPVTVRADALERAGLHDIEIVFAVASRWRWREERYAFATRLTLNVEGEDAAAAPVVNIGGERAGHGNTVYIAGRDASERERERTAEAGDLPLQRAERHEHRFELRGMGEAGRVARDAELRFEGFALDDAPMPAPILSADSLITVGRSRTAQRGGPGDVRLLPHRADGCVDVDLAQLVSRRHFELYIENERLILRVTGSGGLLVNGKAKSREDIVALRDGDVIAPIARHPESVQLETRFQAQHGRVGEIRLTRVGGPAGKA